jgi:hypothetical protein
MRSRAFRWGPILQDSRQTDQSDHVFAGHTGASEGNRRAAQSSQLANVRGSCRVSDIPLRSGMGRKRKSRTAQ